MEILDYGNFIYQNNKLYCEKIAVSQIIEKTSTPAYIYSKKHLQSQYKNFSSAFEGIPHKVFFAVKANFNLHIIKTFADMGSYFDANSLGEIERVKRAGVSTDRIAFSGVGKSDEEIEYALNEGILVFKSESEEEINIINDIANKMNKKAVISIRVNPDVDPHTHPYISTGLAENKFGINAKDSLNVFRRVNKLSNIIIDGIDMHIGSQINKPEPFIEAVEKLSEIFFVLKSEGIELKHLDLGGGFGIKYKTEIPLDLGKLAELLKPSLSKLNCEIYFEPGRYLTANAGILVTKVLYPKKNLNKNFIIVDAAMNDLIRPSLYDAYHHIQPVEANPRCKDFYADIVGPICESGDFFAKDRVFTCVKKDDLIAIMSAGSYGMVMASNYNGRPRPVEILVEEDTFKVIRSRETMEQMMFDEEKLINDNYLQV